MTRKLLALCLFALATNAFALTQARVAGKIIDAVTKKPVPNATITAVATEQRTYNQTYNAKPDGTYQFIILDGTIHYKMTWAAPGYASYEEVMKFKVGGELNEKNIELTPSSNQPAATGGGKAEPDPTVSAYNEGAKLFNEGKTAEAIAKFKEAVQRKPEMTAGWEALAHADLKVKDYAGAIEAANKALAIDTDDQEMYAVLFDAYTATGDKAKAAEAKKKLPADASSIFNDAVKLLNAGKDSDAEPLLRQAIQANDKFGPAYYELGMVYVRMGKMAEAKQNLLKYIEVDPNGKDVATAKESLKYLQ
ncbi:MAG TPA: tetratricopeptide repeat protein [Thermoanaerobaculia bacterium]|nr:tetratricopeptide repeat protein [Thermoanaerobaculia bacterium]